MARLSRAKRTKRIAKVVLNQKPSPEIALSSLGNFVTFKLPLNCANFCCSNKVRQTNYGSTSFLGKLREVRRRGVE